MTTAVIDGIATLYEVFGSGPPITRRFRWLIAR